jgi:pyridoxine 5-phosphate synthase
MAELSVNLNKIALLRNARHTGAPDLIPFVHVARRAGARGITLHPRPDERHVRRGDVAAIAAAMRPWRPAFELNLEGYPDDRFLDLVAEIAPEQVTLVPDAPDAFTSDAGWRLDGAQRAVAEPAVRRLRALGCRVILFADPDPQAAARIADTGAHGLEIYTGDYAERFRAGRDAQAALHACTALAGAAQAAGLVVNAGHDLNLHNLPAFVAAVPGLAEASIGHELTADALLFGMRDAILAYRHVLGQVLEEHPLD